MVAIAELFNVLVVLWLRIFLPQINDLLRTTIHPKYSFVEAGRLIFVILLSTSSFGTRDKQSETSTSWICKRHIFKCFTIKRKTFWKIQPKSKIQSNIFPLKIGSPENSVRMSTNIIYYIWSEISWLEHVTVIPKRTIMKLGFLRRTKKHFIQ